MKTKTAILGVAIILLLVILPGQLLFEKLYPFPKIIKYGVTFSPKYASYLGLDWQKTYLNILDQLYVKDLRLLSYWDILEPEEKKYDFSQTDFILDNAAKRQVRVLLVIGARQPRWPECQYPSWARKLSVEQRQQKTLEFIQKVVERYKGNSSIWAYQVENEPFAYWFGENCDAPNSEFLQKELALIRRLDPTRSLIITDSGEWSSWIDAMKLSDILGTSIYRKAYNSTLGTYLKYPFMPWIYQLKSILVRKLFAPHNQKTIVVELQTEPWLSDKDAKQNAPLKGNQLFSIENFKDNINFVKRTGFDEDYLWGVEWWYFMAAHGYPEYLDYAKSIF